MSAVAVQSAPLSLPHFQPRHPSAPPASLAAKSRTPGIITLSKPPARSPPRPRKPTPSNTPVATPKSEKTRKPRSRPTSDEDDHEPKGRKEKTSPKPRTRQTPSPDSESKPAPRLAKSRRGMTKSTPALCAAVATQGSAPVPVPQMSSSVSHPSGLSRSAPMPTPAMSQSIPARMRRTWTGSGSRDDPTPKDVPPSPSPPRRVRESKGPMTAPLNGAFPSRPSHARCPSEALFNLSLDETDDEPQDMPILFNRRGGDKVYAGGRFQNGPDTTTLPAPSFLSGF